MNTRESTHPLKQSNLDLESLRYLLRLSIDLHFINLRRYEYASRAVDEIGRLIGGWLKSIGKLGTTQQAAK